MSYKADDIAEDLSTICLPLFVVQWAWPIPIIPHILYSMRRMNRETHGSVGKIGIDNDTEYSGEGWPGAPILTTSTMISGISNYIRGYWPFYRYSKSRSCTLPLVFFYRGHPMYTNL
jgi:hypothetical protein